MKEGTLGPALSTATIAHRAVADLLALYRDRDAMEFTALALGHVYGTRQRPAAGVVAAFVAARRSGAGAEIHGNGKQTRDFVAVDDTVDAIVRATTPRHGLGDQRRHRCADLDQPAATSGSWAAPAATATHTPARTDEVDRLALSPVRARIHLAWAPWTDLATGVAELIAAAAVEDAARAGEATGADPPAEVG